MNKTKKGCGKMSKKVSMFVLSLVVIASMMFVGGCGETKWTENHYYYPDWTSDGKIICIKEVVEYSRGLSGPFPGLSSTSRVSEKYYITTMSEEGTQETDIKEIAGIGKLSASPLGNYIAYTDGDFVRIISVSGEEIGSINLDYEVETVDWSLNGIQLVCGVNVDIASDNQIILVNYDGSSKEVIAFGRTPSWLPNDGINKIVYSANDGVISFYDLILSSVSKIDMVGFQFDWFLDGQNILFVDRGIWRVGVNGTGKIKLIDDLLSYPKLSLSNLKIVCGDTNNSGIWLFDVDGANEKQIK